MSMTNCVLSVTTRECCIVQDLLPASSTTGVTTRRVHVNQVPVPPRQYGNKEVLRSADFRNLQFLDRFVSDGGQIVSRQKTKLQSKVHRHLARQIKTARVMALLPHAGKKCYWRIQMHATRRTGTQIVQCQCTSLVVANSGVM